MVDCDESPAGSCEIAEAPVCNTCLTGLHKHPRAAQKPLQRESNTTAQHKQGLPKRLQSLFVCYCRCHFINLSTNSRAWASKRPALPPSALHLLVGGSAGTRAAEPRRARAQPHCSAPAHPKSTTQSVLCQKGVWGTLVSECSHKHLNRNSF